MYPLYAFGSGNSVSTNQRRSGSDQVLPGRRRCLLSEGQEAMGGSCARRGDGKGGNREGLWGWATVAVTETPHRFNESRSFMVALDLSTQITHVKAHNVQRADIFPTPDLIQQLVLAQYLIVISGQDHQKTKLGGAQFHWFATDKNLVPGEIDGDLSI